MDPLLELVTGALDTMRSVKTRATARGEPNMCPMLDLYRDGVSLGVLGVTEKRGARRTKMPLAVALSDADVALFVCDAYGGPVVGDVDELPDDTYKDLFESGDPAVTEALVAWTSTRDGRGVYAAVDYRCQGRDIDWSEPTVVERAHDPCEAVPAALARGFELQSLRVDAGHGPDPIAAIGEKLGWFVVVPALTPPPRNAPCPCGSGAKAKACCWG